MKSVVLLIIWNVVIAPVASWAIEPSGNTNAPITVTADNISDLIFQANPDILRAENAVFRARDQLNVARGELIPQLNIGLLLTLSNPTTFVINSVSCLVPYLFPANWTRLREARRSYEASQTGYEIARLNVYATALNLLVRIQNDAATLRATENQYRLVSSYLDVLRVRYAAGLLTEPDFIRAQIDANRVHIDLSRLRQLVAREKAQLRHLLGFDLSQDFQISPIEITPSSYENENVEHLHELVYLRALERLQLEQLQSAANAGLNTARFAFLGGCSGAQNFTNTPTTGSNTFAMSTATTVNLGFGYFYRIQIAKRNIRDIELRQRDLQLELAQTLDISLNSVHNTYRQQEDASANLQFARRLVEQQRAMFDLGTSTVKEVLDAMNAYFAAQVIYLQTASDLAGHRITLKRTTLEGKFLRLLIQMRRDD